MFKFIKRLFCKHEYLFVGTYTVYDYTYEMNITADYFRCRKCNKIKRELN